MENINFKELREINTSKVANAFANSRKDFSLNKSDQIDTIVAAYIINEMQSTVISSSLEEYLEKSLSNDSIKEIIKRHQNNCWEIVTNNLSKFTSYELIAFILFDNSFENYFPQDGSTPAGVLRLANRILDVKKDDEVLELCSGKGNFLVELTADGYCADYTGIELNYTNIDIATIRASLIRENYKYIISDALDYRPENKVDKIFANYPFGIRWIGAKKAFQEEFNIPASLIQRASSDWLFNLAIISQLNDGGKAVAIMTNGSTWNNSDRQIRQYFVEQGFIEMVISLPERLFAGTTIPVTMLVLSKNNKSIKFVDAKDICVAERRRNIISDDNINDILCLVNEEGEKSITKSIEELSANDFVINPNRYIDTLPEIKNGVPFETIIKKITRGSQLKADELDELKSNSPTNNQYLLLANINDGIISLDNEDQYLKEIPQKLGKYCIQNNSIILSKIGTPSFKSAVAQVEDNTRMIANGNMFVIEIDEEKANPYYIQSFLESDLGKATLKSIYTGTTITSLNISLLNKMIIPLPSLEEQTVIANKYAATIDELVLLSRKIEKVKNKMKHIFEEGTNC